MRFFTGDPHFNHSSIIRHCGRPFPNTDVMNATIVDNLNSVLDSGSLLYILGDVGFGLWSALEEILRSIKGRKILINAFGGHEKTGMRCKHMFDKVTPLEVIKCRGQHITLCHFAMRTWHKSHYNSFHLFGHSHGKLLPIGKSYDVGVDNNNFMPVSEDQVFEIMKTRPDNPGYLKLLEIKARQDANNVLGDRI